MKRIFVGPKQKTIKYTDFFDASITLIGKNDSNNVSYSEDIPFEFWNDDNNQREIDIYSKALSNLSEDAEVMAYNPKLVSRCIFPKNVKLICKNSDELLEKLDDKIELRKLFKGIVPMLEYYTIKGEDFNYKQLSNISKELVVQSPLGSGGAKTFFCNEDNNERIKGKLIKSQYYSISAYKKNNISYTIYGIIGKNQVEILPPAQQIFEIGDNLEWYDSIYETNVSQTAKEKLIKYTTIICKSVQSMGYRGILNLDFIFADEELYLIEANPRFGGTIVEIDKLLQKSGLPSIFEYNYRAFYDLEIPTTKNMEKSIF
ncbi:MAG: ATP-grasp domain-containing protein [Clostridia bacterium]|nr:ATP-grasp domain-containing protein [Clostridia bacterium]